MAATTTSGDIARFGGAGGPPAAPVDDARVCVLAVDFRPIAFHCSVCGGPSARRRSFVRKCSRYTTGLPAEPTHQPPGPRAYAAWAAVCLIWGTTYLAIRIALETIPPLFMAGARWVIAGSVLVAILKLRGVRLPARREWPTLTVLGILLLGFGNGAVVWAEQTVPSGLTAVLVATSPFWMVGFDALMPDGVRLTVRRLAGLVVGFAGIVMLVWPELAGDGGGARAFLIGVVSAQLACIGWAAGSSYARWRGRGSARHENVLATAAFEMLFGGLVLSAASAILGEPARVAFTTRTAGALAYLIVVGAIGGFGAYAYALKHLPVATVSLYAYVNPIIAVVLGTLILNESLNARIAVAGAIVLAGMLLVRGPNRGAN